MSAHHETVARIRQAYEHWHAARGGDPKIWLDLMADHVTMRSLANGAQGHQGKDIAEQYFAAVSSDWEMLDMHAEEFITQGDRLVVIGHVKFRYRKTGKVVESPKIDIYRLKDGQIVDFFDFFDTARAFAATLPDPA